MHKLIYNFTLNINNVLKKIIFKDKYFKILLRIKIIPVSMMTLNQGWPMDRPPGGVQGGGKLDI